MWALDRPPRLRGVTEEVLVSRVEVSCVGGPPVHEIERASGVSEVEIEGSTLRCLVCGSFQPFIEALRGHEVIHLESTPEPAARSKLLTKGELTYDVPKRPGKNRRARRIPR